MLELPEGILAHLEDGGTVVTPSRQRAAALRLAHSARMLVVGRTVWPSPDILPWSAWVERELAQARARGEPMPRRLSATQQWQGWREAVLAACAGLDILAPERLLDAVRRAVELIDDYALQFPATGSAEARLLLTARDHYRRRCQQQEALGADSWVDCAAWLRPSGRLLLAGFLELGPARRRWLAQQGARIHEEGTPESRGARMALYTAPTPTAEAQAAADWCAERLSRDPGARLLLIVPRLAEQRHLWQRALSQRLDARRILDHPEGSAAEQASFVIEGGRALREHPLVAAALDVIALGTGRASLEQLLALLRSPYLTAWDRVARLRLELWLRQYGLEPLTIGGLMRAAPGIEQRAGAGCAALLLAMQATLHPLEGAERPFRSRAEQFADALTASGWPGGELDSHDQQVRQRFEALLGELAALDPEGQQLSSAQAAALLEELAVREHFEPASDDVAVTVTASLDDPIVRYDGIWAAGLSADVWPRPTQPDPLIPSTVQRTAELPGSSPGQALIRARALQALWSRRAGECVLSWAQSEEDLPAQPSPLLRGLPTVPAPEHFDLSSWIAALSPPRQRWHEPRGTPWPAHRDLHGGARLLELQSLCPFRGYAELRLGAGELRTVEGGVAARERGRMLHRALELLWGRLRGSEALSTQLPYAQELAAECAAQALAEVAPEAPGPLAELLLERERERMRELLLQLLEWERARAPFRIEQLEWPTSLVMAGHRLTLRLDRIDRLEDGRLLVLDYKSGRARSFDAFAQRPAQPQLAAYALALGSEVAGVSMLYLARDEVAVKGIADRTDRLAKLRAVPEGLGWTALQEQWRASLQALVQEFVDGHAALEPQPRACERCHLQILCRVDALTQERARDRAELQAQEPGADGAEATEGAGSG